MRAIGGRKLRIENHQFRSRAGGGGWLSDEGGGVRVRTGWVGTGEGGFRRYEAVKETCRRQCVKGIGDANVGCSVICPESINWIGQKGGHALYNGLRRFVGVEGDVRGGNWVGGCCKDASKSRQVEQNQTKVS